MDQVYPYIRLGLYWGLIAAFWISYVILLGHLLWNKQWLFAFLSIFFTAAFYYAGPFIVLGPLIALVIGWQENEKWKIKKLLRINSALLIMCFLLLGHDLYVVITTPPPKVDPQKLARERAQKAAKAALHKR